MDEENPFKNPLPQKRYGILLSATPQQYELITTMAKDLGISRNALLKLALASFTDKWFEQQKEKNR